MGVESTVLAPKKRRLEAHKLAGGPRIVDSTMLRPLMWLESTAESRLDAVKLAQRRHALAHPAARSRPEAAAQACPGMGLRECGRCSRSPGMPCSLPRSLCDFWRRALPRRGLGGLLCSDAQFHTEGRRSAGKGACW